MRTALGIAIGLAVVVSGVPAAFAQDWRALDHGEAAGTGSKATERQTHQELGSNTGISLAVPIGRVLVGADPVGGEPIYVRRTTASGRMTIVEVSTTPFMPVLASRQTKNRILARPDQPAGW